MSMVASLGIAITAEGDAFEAVLVQAEQKVKEFADKTDATLGNVGASAGKGGFGAFIDSAKSGAAEIASVAGAIKLASAAADKTAQAVSGFARELMAGDKSAAELTQHFLDSLPIVGDATKATQSVESAVADVSAATLQWLGYSDQVVERWMSSDALAAKVAQSAEKTARNWETLRKSTDLAQSYDDQLELLNAASDADRERIKLAHELRDELKKIDEMGANPRRFELQDKARALDEAKRADLEKRLAKEVADEKAKADEKALEANGKKLEAEAKFWIDKWNKLGEIAKKAKAEDDKQKAEQEKLMDSAAAKLYDATRTPVEELTNKLAEIDTLMDAGKLDPETAKRAALQATEALGQPREEVLAGVAAKGSAEAFANSRRSIEGQDKVDKQQLDALNKILDALKQQLRAAGAVDVEEIQLGAL